MWERYICPASVSEALDILQSYKGQARIIAGGTDLIPQLKKQIRVVECLVDITEIKELKYIERDQNNIKIGAGVTHSEVASSKLIQKQATVLAEAAFSVGSPLIRNQGTVVGNVVNAQPAADAAVALFALEAKAEITTINGSRFVPLGDLYQGIGQSKVDSTTEIITGLHFSSLGNSQGSTFTRLAQRKALALPMLNVAVVISIQDGHFEEVKIVVAPVAPIPFRSRKAEAALRGKPIGLDSIGNAAEVAAAEARPRDSALRGSKEYRREMVKILVRRSIEHAVQRVKQK